MILLAPFGFSGSSRPRRGAAMTEMVLALPLVFFILAVLFIFGRGYERVQQLLIAGRYEADRRALHAQGPAGDTVDSEDLVSLLLPDPEVEIATRVDGSLPTDANDELLATIASNRGEAVDYYTAAIDRLPDAVDATLTAHWPSWMPLEEQMLGDTSLRHTRLANDWKHANRVFYSAEDDVPGGDAQDYTSPYVRIMPLLRDVYFRVLDDNLGALADSDNPLARDLRTFYTNPEPYRGPELPEDWFTGF